MTFTQAIRSVLSSYATFSGRARRSEYWWFYLFTVLVVLAATAIDAAINLAFRNDIGIVGLITSLTLLLPTLAVTARRLHDTGRRGWWMLLPLVPLVATIVLVFVVVIAAISAAVSAEIDGSPAVAAIVALVLCAVITLAASITLLVFLCRDSHPVPNKYGPSPKPPLTLPSWPGGSYAPQP